jgi:branched-chain amino acid transport system substrate-binding protein
MSMKKWFKLFVPIAAVALLAAACGDDDDDAAGDDTVETTTAPAEGGDTTTAPAAGGAVCEGLTIAFFGAQTGDAANLGLNESRGVELAIDEFNAANPDCQVGYKFFDSQGNPDNAPALAQQAADDSSIVGIVGPAFSGESRTANPIFQEAGLPIVTPSASAPDLSTLNWTIFHRLIANDDSQGPAIAAHISGELAAKKVAVIDDNSEYGKSLAAIVAEGLEAAGVEVAVTDSIDPASQDYSATVTKVNDAGVDAVMYGGYYAEAGRLRKQLVDGGVTATFISGDGALDPGFIDAAGAEAAEGAILTAAAFFSPDGYTGGADFGARFTAASDGNAPGLYSAEGFDGANLLLSAIAAGNQDRASINTYLDGVTFEGLTKTFKFHPNGELDGPVAIYATVVQGGELVGLGQIGS